MPPNDHDIDRVNYAERIPNNVDLSMNRRLQRALEAWQPRFASWWEEFGPEDTREDEIYLRTAISVESDGWANFGYVKMREYRWGIFLAKQDDDRRIAFGDHRGEPAWQDVPGEYRSLLRRLLVTQGDTEPASVEQQRHLGATCPSLYDLRNLYQVNVEEGRHLWAIVYLLHAHFGRDGREEADGMLERHSGDPDRPRILGAFNEATPHWLSYLLFTYFTDRDGKYQLASLAESAFDPLARTCRFMLTEEAHHMFVGESGMMRVCERTCDVMNEIGTDDPARVRAAGAIDFPTLQRFINFHSSVSIDLFGREISTNGANYYSAGLKGRYREERIDDDHQLRDTSYAVWMPSDGGPSLLEQPAITALNERLRDDYFADCQRGLDRWNNAIRTKGIDFALRLPHRAFNRRIGHFAGLHISPEGRVISQSEWEQQCAGWLPTEDDHAFVASLMTRVVAPGAVAGWIGQPARGIDGKALDFNYVRFAEA